jgi:hypothetical protein
MSPATVYLAVPHYDTLIAQALPGVMLASKQHRYVLAMEGGSLLALVFNHLWCRALNDRHKDGYSHFAMHHADMEAPAGWMDRLIDEQRRVDADVLSVVVPIKDARGLTSTGVRHPETGHIRRFTMKEIHETLPPTFSIHDTPWKDHWLMVNTGLWVCDFSKPWVEHVCFSILDSVIKTEDGRFQARTLPEDWNFSGWCARKGLRVFATRVLNVSHHGRGIFRNDTVWGDWQTDLGDQRLN